MKVVVHSSSFIQRKGHSRGRVLYSSINVKIEEVKLKCDLISNHENNFKSHLSCFVISNITKKQLITNTTSCYSRVTFKIGFMDRY